MTRYVERPKTIEARKVTAETAAEVAAWCGGTAIPGAGVFYPMGELSAQAPLGSYIVEEAGPMYRHQDGATFEAAWAEAPDQD